MDFDAKESEGTREKIRRGRENQRERQRSD